MSSLRPGSRLGGFEIVGALGSGGMGEVYRGRDTKLKRDVALKMLPDALALDPERLARFQREAEVLAALNHPHIAQIYGVEDSATVSAIVMELVEGEDLSTRIARGAIPLAEALLIARQIAEALEAAHDHGIVHRDLKPANIKIRDDGTVKVLDFGLAKAMDRGSGQGDRGSADLANSPTTIDLSAHGVILGTAAYMSPEQARGKPVDRRADIWAFGCVLYEMLTGRRVFGGDTATDILAHVLEREPDWTALPTNTPPAIRRTLRRCLEKDSKRRLPHIGVARMEIDDAIAKPESSDRIPAAILRTRWGRGATVVVAVATALAGLAAGLWISAKRPPSMPARDVVRSIVKADGGIGPRDRDLALSPDGTQIVYAANGRLYLRALDRLDSSPIPGTEGGHGPFFEPSGNVVGFFTSDQLKRVGVRGEAVQTIARVLNGQHGSWSDDGWIYYALNSGSEIFRVRATGDAPEAVTTLGKDVDHNYPSVLPGGSLLLVGVYRAADENWNHAAIALYSLETRTFKVLVDAGSNARFLRPGHVVFHRDGSLLSVPIDLGSQMTTGPARTVIQGVMRDSIGQNALFDVSPSGLLAYVGATMASGLGTLVLVDRSGTEAPIDIDPGVYSEPRFSPDGTRIAINLGTRVGIHDLSRHTTMRLPAHSVQRWPLWMPDGERLVFSGIGEAAREALYMQRADGTGQPEHIVEGSHPFSITADGRYVFYRRVTGTGGFKIFVFPLDRAGPPVPLLPPGSDGEPSAALSPNGRLVAYTIEENGESQLYVRTFPNIELRRALVGPGRTPVWGPDSRELFYIDTAGQTLYRVVVQSDASVQARGGERVLTASTYSLLVDARNAYLSGLPNFDVSPDGRRFVMVKRLDPNQTSGASNEIVLVQNWQEELKATVSGK